MVPPLIAIELLASIASDVHVTLIVPPVIFKSSLLVIPLAVDEIVNVPVPFNTKSSFEKITASVLVLPSLVNEFETVKLLLPVVVMNTLSAFLIYIHGVLSFSMVKSLSTNCTLDSSSVLTIIDTFFALPLITYIPSVVILIFSPLFTVYFVALLTSTVCSRSLSVKMSLSFNSLATVTVLFSLSLEPHPTIVVSRLNNRIPIIIFFLIFFLLSFDIRIILFIY